MNSTLSRGPRSRGGRPKPGGRSHGQRRTPVLLVCATAGPFVVGQLRAQALPVRVLEHESLTPLVGALVRLTRADSVFAVGLTNQSGRVTLQVSVPGEFVLQVTAIGRLIRDRWTVRVDSLVPRELLLTVDAPPVVIPPRARFEIVSLPQVLPEVEVRAGSERAVGRMAGFEERRQTSLGRFFDREFLVLQEHSTVGLILDRIPRVRMVFAGNQAAAANSLRSSLAEQRYRPPWPPACYMAVYLDGIRVWSPGSGFPSPYDLNQHSVASLEGIEVYTGADTPTQFSGTGAECGTIVLWTRES